MLLTYLFNNVLVKSNTDLTNPFKNMSFLNTRWRKISWLKMPLWRPRTSAATPSSASSSRWQPSTPSTSKTIRYHFLQLQIKKARQFWQVGVIFWQSKQSSFFWSCSRGNLMVNFPQKLKSEFKNIYYTFTLYGTVVDYAKKQ